MQPLHRIILFRFHSHFDICRNHLTLLRLFNPEIEIFGLYGGPKKDWPRARRMPFVHVWQIPLDDPYWKWLSGDLAVRWWYQSVGRDVRFDMLHLLEWDCLLLVDINERFAHIRDGVALTALERRGANFNRWNWTAPVRGRWELRKLMDHISCHYGARPQHCRCLFGGVILSRAFVDQYAGIEVPGLCNDEVRVPLFAQAFGMRLADTGLGGKYFTGSEKVFVSERQVLTQVRRGITAFHPVKVAVSVRAVRTR